MTGLPVQVRDAALKVQDNMPKSDVNKEYYQQNMEKEVCMILLRNLALLNPDMLCPYKQCIPAQWLSDRASAL